MQPNEKQILSCLSDKQLLLETFICITQNIDLISLESNVYPRTELYQLKRYVEEIQRRILYND